VYAGGWRALSPGPDRDELAGIIEAARHGSPELAAA
jgi:hypothetical protein